MISCSRISYWMNGFVSTNSLVPSSLVPIFKRKRDPLNPNSYRGTKLLEHSFKLYEKILDERLRKVVGIDKMQYGFLPGRETVDYWTPALWQEGVL